MPPYQECSRTGKCLVWEATGAFGPDGRIIVSSTYVELDVRLVYGTTQVTDSQGNKVAVDATLVLDREIAIGSLVWDGSAAELQASVPGTDTSTSLKPLDSLLEVVFTKTTKDIKGRWIRYTANLRFYKDTFPT